MAATLAQASGTFSRLTLRTIAFLLVVTVPPVSTPIACIDSTDNLLRLLWLVGYSRHQLQNPVDYSLGIRWATRNVKVDGDQGVDSVACVVAVSHHPSSERACSDGDHESGLGHLVIDGLEAVFHQRVHGTCHQQDIGVPWTGD